MRLSLLLSILIVFVIWGNSMLPANLSSAQSGFIVTLARDMFTFIGLNIFDETLSLLIRKLAHFTEFLLLGITLTIYLKQLGKKWFYVLLIGFVVASIDETIQLFVSGRHGSILDVFIDMIGVSFGLFIVSYIYKRKEANQIQ
jgi:VanZ family protein